MHLDDTWWWKSFSLRPSYTFWSEKLCVLLQYPVYALQRALTEKLPFWHSSLEVNKVTDVDNYTEKEIV